MNTEEQILVVPATALEELGAFEGFRPDDGGYVASLLTRGDLSFRPRGAMESDPSFKQLIPYVILEYFNGSELQVFCYTRGSGQGEKRLHAKKSIGIGGHISLEDVGGTAVGLQDPYRRGMLRELEEEVVMETECSESLFGLIYDPSTEVGQVHIGIVHRMRVQQPNVRAREKDLVDAGFVSFDKLVAELPQFETWSQLALKALMATERHTSSVA